MSRVGESLVRSAAGRDTNVGRRFRDLLASTNIEISLVSSYGLV